MARFDFCGLHPWFGGGGGGGGGREGEEDGGFHFILSKMVVWGTRKTEWEEANPPKDLLQKSEWH